ncbi:hypothetical protein ACTI_64530 [Actinoplanes sp. OR16]|uniref:class I SAM-dependent methyltransferase n=1 Tax=Actinoplanes sp. OR16 TaxID=946334 RepID=UPI000F701577|nr:class I SAM-dependent methyltransferase [Actinoplanes sp. OR16]BBH69768.1 hypothetical protein ACTI_64530 [Actinoplanes sp. OR16]
MTDTDFVPAMGKRWLLPLYDPFSRLAGAGRVHRQLLDHAALTGDQDILEIGCGTGNLLTALARRRPAATLHGIDPDPGALAIARRKARRRGLTIRYERAFAGALPYENGAMDRVLSSFMLHHLDENARARALTEAARVLRPGGELHIADVDGTDKHGDSHRHPLIAAASPDRVLAALREAGFTRVAESLRGTSRFGAYVLYRATAQR